jgi:hypothetical protein
VTHRLPLVVARIPALLPALLAGVLVSGCEPAPAPPAETATAPAPAAANPPPNGLPSPSTVARQPDQGLGTSSGNSPRSNRASRDPVKTIESFLLDLESELKLSTADTWTIRATAARNDLGNIWIELDELRRKNVKINELETWLTDLEGKLRSPTPDNWSRNLPAAKSIVGQARLELQNLDRR